MMEAEVLLYYQMPPEHPAVGALVDWSPICDRCAPVRVTGSCYRHIERRPLLWSVDPNGSRIPIPIATCRHSQTTKQIVLAQRRRDEARG